MDVLTASLIEFTKQAEQSVFLEGCLLLNLSTDRLIALALLMLEELLPLSFSGEEE